MEKKEKVGGEKGEDDRVGVIIKEDPGCPLRRGSLHVMNVKGV